jgi:hypothetical protein
MSIIQSFQVRIAAYRMAPAYGLHPCATPIVTPNSRRQGLVLTIAAPPDGQALGPGEPRRWASVAMGSRIHAFRTFLALP